MMNFQNAKSITTPRGEVLRISRSGVLLWQKPYKKELLYLESTGTQYIDVGLKLTSDYSVEIDYQLTELPQYRTGLFGGLYTANPTIRYGSILSPSNSYLEHGYGLNNTYYQQGYPDTNRHLLRQEKNVIYMDDVLIYTFAQSSFSATKNAYLGNFDYTNYKPAKAKYYSSKWWNGDTLVRDFIPVIDLNDRPCFYDKVTKQLFYNQGTEEFLYGEILYKKKISYLQGTGTQYIDTEITINTATDTVELVFQNTEPNVYKWLFGEHDNNARFGLGSGDGTNKRNVAYGKTTYKVTDKQLYDSKHTFIANENGVFLDNVKIASFSSFSSTSTLYLFNLNLSSGNYLCRAKIWSYKHTRNGVLIRNFIPVLDMNDKPCMYNETTNELFYNIGTGDFLYE